MKFSFLLHDARYFQLLFQCIFLLYGIFYLHWDADILNCIIYFSICLLTQFFCELIRSGLSIHKSLPAKFFGGSWKSAAITAFGLSLLLKTNSLYVCALAAFLSISSKYIFTRNKKHLFNPSAIGIVLTILLTHAAWISPGQWGSGFVLFFMILSLGFIVVTKVQKADISLAFLSTYTLLLFWRQVSYLGWSYDFFIHSLSTGSLLLFSFFMISDPKTTPNNSVARILWGVVIAGISFYLSAFKFINAAPVWVLVFMSPAVPLLDILFKGKLFIWKSSAQTVIVNKHPTSIVTAA